MPDSIKKFDEQQNNELNGADTFCLINKIINILCSAKDNQENNKSGLISSDATARQIAGRIYGVIRYRLNKKGNCYNSEECLEDITQNLCRKLQVKRDGEIIKNLEFYCITSAKNCTTDYLLKKCHLCRKSQVSLEDEEIRSASRSELCLPPQTIRMDEVINDLEKFSQTLDEEDLDWMNSFKDKGVDDESLYIKFRIRKPELTEEAFKQRKWRKRKDLAIRFKFFRVSGESTSKGNANK